MQIKKRLERLDQGYFPGRKMRGLYLYEGDFIGAFHKKYHGREDSAPIILRSVYDRLTKRRRPSERKPEPGDTSEGIAVGRQGRNVNPVGNRKEKS